MMTKSPRCVQLSGYEGSFVLHKITDKKTGNIKGEYWYQHTYDPTTKKMKTKYIGKHLPIVTQKDKHEVAQEVKHDSSKTPTESENKAKYDGLYHNVLSLIDRCLQNPCPVKHQRPPGWVLDELLPLDSHLSQDVEHLLSYPTLVKLQARRQG